MECCYPLLEVLTMPSLSSKSAAVQSFCNTVTKATSRATILCMPNLKSIACLQVQHMHKSPVVCVCLHESSYLVVLTGQEEELQEQVATQQQQLQEAAMQLSLRRQAAGGKLKAAVEKCLAELAMQDSQFDVDLTWLEAQQARTAELHTSSTV